MIDTSTELFNAFLEDTRQIMVKVTIGNRVFDNDNIATLSLEYGSMDGGSLDIGGAFANSLKIGFSELVEGLAELDEIEVEMGAVLPNGTIEYVPMGTFVINEEVMMDRNNNTTSIDAMDRMVMLGEIYEPTLEGDSARIIDIAVDIANQAGVIVSSDFDRLLTDSILIPREKTLREAIGIIAQFEVGFAIFNRDGELTIRGLKDADFHVSPEEYTMKGLVKNEVPFRLNGVQCTTGDGEDDVLTSGGTRGNQIYLQNESMTQEHLNRIHHSLTSLNYYPFTLDWYGHPALEAGDWIEIEDLQGNKFKTPNLHYTLDFNGGLKAKSQAETTSSSEVVYQYKSPLKQEIQAIAARLSASGGNHVYDDLTEPENPKEGDLWFKPEGPDTLILKYTRLEDGSLDWVEELNAADIKKNAREIEAVIEQAETDRAELEEEIGNSLLLAKEHAQSEDARIRGELESDIGGAIEIAEQAKADAVTKANQALADAKAHADSEILQFSEHFDGVLAEVESDVTNAQATADSAVEQIDLAVANAGFTSLDDTLQNMNYITTNAEQSAQQAITNASDAYGLAQTSISEAQTAQENSLTALGKADNALDGVSNLDIRVDDVEAELELKADNTFMNEDGTLTTLSNAITFNAHRFSSDMSRIESRVESLSGAVNLVVLRDAFKGSWLTGGEVYPNATKNSQTGNSDTMREMIDVTPGEQLALTKTTVPGDNYWRINCYTQNMEFITRLTPIANETLITVPDNAHHIWVSYPQESNPQIVRGETFVPYRPNITDQMTADEVIIFRNEYDEFADKTERRLTSIDSPGGRLATAELLITQTANGLALKADQTTVNELTGEVENLGTEFDIVAGQISSKVWKSDIDDIEIGGRNLLPNTDFSDSENTSKWDAKDRATSIAPYKIGTFGLARVSIGEYEIGDNARIYSKNGASLKNGQEYTLSFIGISSGWFDDSFNKIHLHVIDDGYKALPIPTKELIGRVMYSGASRDVYKYTLKFKYAYESSNDVRLLIGSTMPTGVGTGHWFFIGDIKLEKGNKATDWTPAHEDTDAKINHVESSLTIEAGRINALNTRVGSNETFINDLSLTPDGFWVRTARYDRATERIESIATLEQTVEGLQSEVYNADGSSKITQLATGVSSLVTNVSQLEEDGRNLIRRENERKNVLIGPNGEAIADNSNNRTYYSISVEAGKTYMISQSGSMQSSPYIRIAEYRKDGSFRQRLTTSSESYMYVPEEAVDHIRISYPNDADVKMEVGSKVTPYSPAPEDTATTSQISQLSDNINLRVSKDDIINQINVSTEGILIDGKKTHITGTTTIDNGVIKNAHIGNLNASKINAGTINSARINATEIVTNGLTTNVIKSTHINTSTATIDKLFANETMINRLTSKTAFINSIKAVNIDASRITSGTISAARLNASAIVTDGLTANVVKSTHISADTALFDKLFTSKLATDRLSAQTAWIKTANIASASITNVKIADGAIDTAKIAYLDVGKISGKTTEFVSSNWNSINSRADIDADRLRFTHADGSSTQIGVNGLERVESGATRPYQYRTYVGSSEVSGELLANGTNINLPADFKGKDFTVVVSLQGWFGRNIDLTTYKPNMVRVYIDGTNKSLGRFTVKGRFAGNTYKRGSYWLRKTLTDRTSDFQWVEFIDTANMTDAIFGEGITVYLTYTATY